MYTIIFCNDWDNWVEIFRGTLAECESWRDRHIAKFEQLDAIIVKS